MKIRTFETLFAVYLLAIVALVLGIGATADTPKPSTRPAAVVSPFYGPSVWMQPASSFAKWRSRGVTALLGCPMDAQGNAAEGISPVEWCEDADAAGLKYWLQYRKATASLISRRGCIGVLQEPDEPNGSGNQTPGQVVDETTSIRQNTSKPIMVNLDGAATRWIDDATLAAYLKSDAVAFDYYPLQRAEGPEAIPQIGQILARIQRLAPGKPVIVCVDTCDQQLALSDWGKQVTAAGGIMRGPTVDEFRAELDQVKTAAGICFFPDVIGAGWVSFDGTTPEIAAAMTRLQIPPPATQPKPEIPPTIYRQADPQSVIFTTITINGQLYDLSPRK